jgi:hypothetical protein
MLLVGVSSAFGALYTFNFNSGSLTTGTTLTISSVEDVNVQVTLSTLTGIVGVDGSGAVVIATTGNNTDIQQNERLIITPQFIGPFTLSTVTFGNVETGGGNSGDQSIVYLDGVSAGAFNLPNSGVTIGGASVPGSDIFTTSIAFAGSDGNDDFRVTQIVIDGIANSAAVPEPATWTLLGFGVAALAWFRRKRS